MAKILMVDDNQDFLEAAKAVLEAKGYAVFTAENVRSGEELVKNEVPDLIFLDIMMEQPDDGIALAQKLRKDGVETPIVMLSAVSKVTGYEYDKCDEVLPCNDFLQKPVKPQDLLNKVAAILNS